MEVYLIDGTYELFRQFFGRPSSTAADGSEIAATRGVVWSVASLLSQGITHIGVAICGPATRPVPRCRLSSGPSSPFSRKRSNT